MDSLCHLYLWHFTVSHQHVLDVLREWITTEETSHPATRFRELCPGYPLHHRRIVSSFNFERSFRVCRDRAGSLLLRILCFCAFQIHELKSLQVDNDSDGNNGGGAGGNNTSGGAGGSGIIIVRYAI